MGANSSKHKRRGHSKKEKSPKKDILKGPVANNTTSTTDATTSTNTTAAITPPETTTTTIAISDGSTLVDTDSNPEHVGSIDNVVASKFSLKDAVVISSSHDDVDIHIDDNNMEQHNEDVVHVCCLLCDVVQGEKFYSLEICGHSFCIPCIFAYSEEQLKNLPEDCCEILCPLEQCECIISIADLKAALVTFGSGAENNDVKDGGGLRGESSGSRNEIPNNNNNDNSASSSSSNKTIISGSKSSTMLPVQLTHSLETFLAKNSNYVHCPNPRCKFVFERLPPTRSHEVVLDEHGNPLSPVALKHRQLNRFRCRACDTNFCAACKTMPYHLGFTCKAYFAAKVAKHCRFCDIALPSNTKPHESCMKSSIVAQHSRKEKSKSFLMLKWKSKERRKSHRKGKGKGAGEDCSEDLENDVEKDGIPQEFYVCNDVECKAKMARSCHLWLDCGHFCRGVNHDFSGCLCLESGCESRAHDGDDYCSICWVEALKSGPTIKLGCSHYFHYACVQKKLSNKWPGPSISFAFASCPLCQDPIVHNMFASELLRINTLRAEVKTKALDRLTIEGLQNDPAITTEGSKYYNNPGDYAVHIFSFYECHLCKHPYFGGKRQCEAEAENVDMSKHNPAELICPGCSTINAECAIHGREYIDFKCRFCCSLATYFCGGKAHFCTPCHDKAGQLVEFTNWTTIAKCPPCNGKPECSLGLHAENGQEFALGCSMCRAAEKSAAE